MHRLKWGLFVVTVGCFSGCGEFVQTGERTTVIDVVGDPTDPTPDPVVQPDILGSVLPVPDEFDGVTESNAAPTTVPPFPNNPADATDSSEGPDVAGGLGIAKPVSLKKKKSRSKLAE